MSKCHGGSVEKSIIKIKKKYLWWTFSGVPKKNLRKITVDFEINDPDCRIYRFWSIIAYMHSVSSDGPKSENAAVLTLYLEIYPVNLVQFFFWELLRMSPRGFSFVLFSEF